MEAPEYQSGFCTQFVTEKRHSIDNKAAAAGGGGGGGGDHFMVEDLLDFSNDEDAVIADTPFEEAATTTAGNSTDSSTVTVVDSCNSSSFSGCDPNFMSDIGCRNFPDANFSSDLCVPYDDLAELEWLSNFVEESFSSEDLQKLQMISGMKARTVDETSETTTQHEPSIRNNSNSSPIFRPEMSVPAKARSKRSRAAPCNWTSRLLVLSQQSTPPPSSPPPPPQHQPSLPPSDPDIAFAKKTVKAAAAYSKKRDGGGGGVESGGDGRKCLHCATDKTPQWRTGPMGPKTLCNACGVRYKSGRLVPEYRPAASPTFMLTKHSNSHRKVLELRRQKEMMRTHHHHHQHHHHHHQQQQQFLHHHHQNMVFDVTNGGDDYLIHSPVGPDFRQLI